MENHQDFLKELTTYSKEALSKSADYISVSLQDNLSLYFSNSNDPAYIVNVLNIGLNPEINKSVSKGLGEFLKNKLGINNDRGYIFFNNVEKPNCGWKGSTFAYMA